jgi:hypothetical protein
MFWFAFGGAIYGFFYGIFAGFLIVPLLSLFFSASQGVFMRSGRMFVDAFAGGGMVGACVGAAAGAISMGVVGLIQGVRPQEKTPGEDFNRHFAGCIWSGFWCALAGSFSGSVFLVSLVLADGGNRVNRGIRESEILGYWVLACYLGGSLFGALAPDALGKFWRRIKATLPIKSPGALAKQNGAED